MKSLYEIDANLKDALYKAEQEAAENEGEISENLTAILDALEGEREDKIGNICRFVKSLNAEAGMIKGEEKALADRRRVTENKSTSLKKYLSDFMSEGEKYSDANSKVTWRASKSVEISGDFTYSEAPDEWVRTSQSWDKTEIKKAVLAGNGLVGVNIVENQNIQIK